MVVIALILLSLAVVMFMILTDTRKNDNFKALERRAAGDAPVVIDAGSSADASCGDGGGGDGGCSAD
ncbi:MAG: hypothetical protein WCO11_04965 [Sphingomonadales bacterium]|jgi:hypothetical protein